MDTAVEGKYAQSSHYEEIDKTNGPDSTTYPGPFPETPPEKIIKPNPSRKRKRPLETESCLEEQEMRDQEILEKIAKAMMEMVKASKSVRTEGVEPKEDSYSMEKCIRALDEIEGVDEEVYLAAIDLFEHPSLRETFISLKSSGIRSTWLRGKCVKVKGAHTLMS